MTNTEVVQAVLAWVRDRTGIESTYDYAPGGKEKPLPDVVAELSTEEVVRNDERFPYSTIQQVWLRAYSIGLSIMVEQGSNSTDPSDQDAAQAAAQTQLRQFGQQIVTGLVEDPTMGGRLGQGVASPLVSIDYTPPFVEYEDGTRGREMTVQLAVADLLED